MFNFLDEQKFLNAYENKIPTLFQNAKLPKISWEEVLDFININQQERTGQKILPEPYCFCYNQAQRIPKVNSIVKQIHSNFELVTIDPKVITCQLFITTIAKEGSVLNKHSDIENNLYWQGKGKTRWRLYSTIENEKPFMDVILEENDMLYIPGSTVHKVDPLSARFSFAILFGNKKNIL